MVGSMRFWSAISRMLLSLALFGLMLGPMAAGSVTPAMATQAMATQGMASMVDGISRCPESPPAVPDCAKICPLAVLCVSSLVSVQNSDAPTWLARPAAADDFLSGKEAVLASYIGEPPPRPPKA